MARNKYGGVNDMPAGWLANKENKRVYVLWFDMLRRCYDEEQLKRVQGSTYRDVPFAIDGFICQTSMKTFKNYLDI